MWFASRFGAIGEAPLYARACVALSLALAGITIALAGDVEFKRAGTTFNPFKPENSSALVTSGVYGFTRNPMYLGLAMALLGWATFLSSAWTLAGPVAFVLYITRFQIVPEERVLAGRFGEAYAGYAARVRRWL